jgi:hypothetical protein
MAALAVAAVSTLTLVAAADAPPSSVELVPVTLEGSVTTSLGEVVPPPPPTPIYATPTYAA